MFDSDLLALAKKVNDRLKTASLTIATVESCTGGLIAGALTAVPGSSAVVHGGFVTYANTAKTDMVGVPAALIARYGAVSEPVARAMAAGARDRTGADIVIAVTGIAGPASEGTDKPVGLVHFGLSSAHGSFHREERFGDLGRDAIRRETVRVALEMVIESLPEIPGQP